MSAASSPSEDLELALQLQREDLEELRKTEKGKRRERETDDFTLAIQLYEAELAACAIAASDQAMCDSIARAVRQDAELIGAMQREEEQAAQDREFARGLSTGGTGTTPTPAKRASTAPALEDQLVAGLKALNFNGPPDSEEHPAESSTWAASRPIARPRKHKQPSIECIGCGDERSPSDVARCPCSHAYCRECLTSLFKASLSDETLFPPRCCGQPIPLDSCRVHLPPNLAGEFQAKKAEMETPNRTYCHQPTCSTFIPTKSIDGVKAWCTRCQKATCVTCKGQAHDGDCPPDAADQELLRVAAENGWQRCYSCRRLVELDHGCNHMTCRCGAQFCYACGLAWKTCGCEQWREDRLIARANAIVDRNANAGQLDDVERVNWLQREVENLMQNHECEHRRWRSRGGSHQCEECYDTLPLFIYECVQCRILACRRCRFNRL